MLWLTFLFPIAVVSVSTPRANLRNAAVLEHEEVKPKLITDEEVTPITVKAHRHEHQYENVGKGNCINTSSVTIGAKPLWQKTKIESNGEAEECASFCTKSEQCGGYISVKEKGECAVILADNPNYLGGIFKADDAEGVICFKKSGLPVMRKHTNGWETFGSEEKTKDPDHTTDTSGGSYDPFQTTTTTPPPKPNNMTAKIIFSLIIIIGAIAGICVYLALVV